MYALDYPDFVRVRHSGSMDGISMEFIIDIDHPVIKYFGMRTRDLDVALYDKDEQEIYKLTILKTKRFLYSSKLAGSGWVYIDHEKFDYGYVNLNNVINRLLYNRAESRFSTVAVMIYQQLKHEYEMENLTREFSNFRKSFDEKLDKIISTIIKEPSEPTTTPVVKEVVEKKLEPKPKLELKDKPKRTSPAFTAETIWKSCKNIGIAKTAVKFEITEDEVRKLKKEYKK